ncbi:MAG: VTT domain-containing protein [Methanoregulaceae archaeon]|nr:VTT domain-containing protein [Methanoregulaceae archaeon]
MPPEGNTTRQYYRKYGKNTIILARVVPGVRSIVPFVAGIVRMDYPVFLLYNVIAGFLWVSGFVLFGHLLPPSPYSKSSRNFSCGPSSASASESCSSCFVISGKT